MSHQREQKIRAKAYELWEAAGRPEGQEKDHWVEAERLVDAEDPSAARQTKPRKSRSKAPAGVQTPPLDNDIPPQKPKRSPAKRTPKQ